MISDHATIQIFGNENIEDLTRSIYDLSNNVTIDSKAIAIFLGRYIREDISSNELVALAEALEVNERLQIKESQNSLINDIFFEIANPEINGFLSVSRARQIIDMLTKAEG